MTEALFRDDAYLRETQATVVSSEPRGVRSIGRSFTRKAADRAAIGGRCSSRTARRFAIVNTVYDADRTTILHVPAEGAPCRRPASA